MAFFYIHEMIISILLIRFVNIFASKFQHIFVMYFFKLDLVTYIFRHSSLYGVTSNQLSIVLIYYDTTPDYYLVTPENTHVILLDKYFKSENLLRLSVARALIGRLTWKLRLGK